MGDGDIVMPCRVLLEVVEEKILITLLLMKFTDIHNFSQGMWQLEVLFYTHYQTTKPLASGVGKAKEKGGKATEPLIRITKGKQAC